MKPHFCRPQSDAKSQFDTDGIAYLPGLFAPREVLELLSSYERLAETLNSAKLKMSNEFAGSSSTRTTSVMLGRFAVAHALDDWAGYFYLSRDIETFRSLLNSTSLAQVIGEIVGAGEVRFWFDEVFVKNPNASGNATPWHHDVANFSFKGALLPTLWIALTDVAANSGPLIAVPGSHRFQKTYRPSRVDARDQLLPGYDVPNFDALIADSNVRAWEMKAGDALLFHHRLIHASLPNTSDGYRIAAVARWICDDASLAPDAYSTPDPWLCVEERWVSDPEAKRLFPIRWRREWQPLT